VREIESLDRRVAGTGHAAELERHAHPARARPAAPRPGVRGQLVRPRSARRRAGPARRASRRGVSATFRLTARGAVLGLFAVCFLTLLFAAVTGWSAIPDMAFVGGCGAGAWYTKRGALLPLAVSPPLIFFLSCLLVQWLTASGTFTTLTGIFVTLGTSAPWLYLGTALTVTIGLYRGLGTEVIDLFIDLRDLVTGR
jgi:hypothetical protein